MAVGPNAVSEESRHSEIDTGGHTYIIVYDLNRGKVILYLELGGSFWVGTMGG